MELMFSFGANIIIWCYHVMLSSWMITPSFFIFPENFTHSSISPKGNTRGRDLGKAYSVKKGKRFFRHQLGCHLYQTLPGRTGDGKTANLFLQCSLPRSTPKLPLNGSVYDGVCVSAYGSLRARGFRGWECNCVCVSLNTTAYSLHKSAMQYTANNFPCMYSQKRFSQASLITSTKYFQNRIIIFCLKL
jgi:hypothetical protein